MITIVFSVLLLGSGLIVKRSRTLYILSILFLWVLMTFTYGNADEGVYLSRYTTPELWANNTEYLFSFLIDVCRKLGLNFFAFKGVTAAIEITLVGKTVWKLSKYPNVVLLFYFLSSFAYNVTQIRFALASSVFIYSIQYLFKDNTTYKSNFFSSNELKYIVGVIIAAFIHTSAVIWLVLLIAKKCNIKTTVIFTIIFNILIIFNISPSFISDFLQGFGAEGRMTAYLSSAYQNSSFRTFGQLKLVLFAAILEIIICAYILKNKNYFENINQIDLIFKMDIIILIIIGFIVKYTPEVYRLQESLFLINYIILMNAIPSDSFLKVKTKIPIFIIENFILILLIGLSYLELYSSSNFFSVWKPLFSNNLLFNSLL